MTIAIRYSDKLVLGCFDDNAYAVRFPHVLDNFLSQPSHLRSVFISRVDTRRILAHGLVSAMDGSLFDQSVFISFFEALAKLPDYSQRATIGYMSQFATEYAYGLILRYCEHSDIDDNSAFYDHEFEIGAIDELDPDDSLLDVRPVVSRVNFNARGGVISSAVAIVNHSVNTYAVRMYNGGNYKVAFRIINQKTDKLVAWGEFRHDCKISTLYKTVDQFMRAYVKPGNIIPPCHKRAWLKVKDPQGDTNLRYAYID